jgi:hypothetical protein
MNGALVFDQLTYNISVRLLEDAVAKSCLTNDLDSGGIVLSPSMIEYFSEARDWLMRMDDTPPWTKLRDGSRARFGAGFCLHIAGIDRALFISSIRTRWEACDDAIHKALVGQLAEEHRAVKQSADRPGKRGPKTRRESKISSIETAIECIVRSKKWREDEQ